MLPAHIAQNIRRQILYYLQATFSFRDKKVDDAFQRFLEDPDFGLFKGPWVQLKRPFRPAPSDVTFPFDINVPFHPFLHQYRSWLRLSEKEHPPQNTIVTTGTGSGKTECFLFPILDHCLRMKKQVQKGIKAIVLYPMNALASDQEKRFAEVIWSDTSLKNVGIRVGNYTGRYDPAEPIAIMPIDSTSVTILYIRMAVPAGFSGAGAGSSGRGSFVVPTGPTPPRITAATTLVSVSRGLISFWFFRFLPFGWGYRGLAPCSRHFFISHREHRDH